MKNIVVHSDGGARGNPGPAAIGVVISDREGHVLKELSESIGEATNNIAEYQAVIRGLKTLLSLYKGETDSLVIEWKLDSELVEKQLAGAYKVKNPGLRALFDEIQDLRVSFPNLSFSHVRREYNKEADRLVNEALDKRPV